MSPDAFLSLGLDVSRETTQRLNALAKLVRKWNKSINLISKSTTNDIWTRHIVDSAQLLACAPADFSSWADFGSGGGFPGLVVSCLHPENTGVTLVERDARKVAFLQEAKRLLSLKCNILYDDIKNLPDLRADVISARALAPLHRLLELTQPHLKDDGIALFPKGAGHMDEVSLAKTDWKMQIEYIQSVTSTDSTILRIRNIAHV
ncbi:16S rRNA (guanine(527)-N(7))-methyltransferase RsmG [Halovulum sp. GXIMD14793]